MPFEPFSIKFKDPERINLPRLLSYLPGRLHDSRMKKQGSRMLRNHRLRLYLKWAHFKRALSSGRSASQWVWSIRNRTRRTLLEASLRRSYERRVERHRLHLPMVNADARAILNAVETEGVHVAPLGLLNVPRTNELLQSASLLLPKLARRPVPPGGFDVHMNQTYLKEFPQLFLWGLNEKLLDMVENYLGVPVGYWGVNLTRSIANDIQHGTRMWHLDPPDHRLFRIIIYLSDVDHDSGPFDYISRQQSGRVRRSLRYSNENVPDSIMRKVTETDHWKSCIGPRGTTIFVDPANVFHRAKVPKSRERIAIFYSYHSTSPLHERYLPQGFSPDLLACMEDKLTERQRDCVFWRS